jgi:hypothetical protein
MARILPFRPIVARSTFRSFLVVVCSLILTQGLMPEPLQSEEPANATSTASSEGAEKSASFVNDVVPWLTKSGCNMGVCHAKAGGGQNGFQLSLLGFEPAEDFEHLV